MVWRHPDSTVQKSVGIHTDCCPVCGPRQGKVKTDGLRNGSKQNVQAESRLKRAEMKAQNIKSEAMHGSWLLGLSRRSPRTSWDDGIVIQPAFRGPRQSLASQNVAGGRRALRLQRQILPTTAGGEESRRTAVSSTAVENSAECLPLKQ